MLACWTSQDCRCQCPWPCGRPLSTHASARDSQTLTDSLAPSLGGITSFSWVLLQASSCLYPPKVSVSLVLWKFCNQIRLNSNSDSLGIPSPFARVRKLGSLSWALKLLQQQENFFRVMVLQFVDHTPIGSVVGLMMTSSKRTYATHTQTPWGKHYSHFDPHWALTPWLSKHLDIWTLMLLWVLQMFLSGQGTLL